MDSHCDPQIFGTVKKSSDQKREEQQPVDFQENGPDFTSENTQWSDDQQYGTCKCDKSGETLSFEPAIVSIFEEMKECHQHR